MVVRRLRWLLAPLLLLSSACGGGGGGDDDEPTACTKPGSLRALAVQGHPAPGTAGVFTAFPSANPLMAAAPGGWCAFVAYTTDPAVPRVLYVALPDGSVLPVWSAGETVPDAGGGTIQDFLLVRVNAAGHVLAEVSLLGDLGGRTFGLLSAQVVGGVVAAKADVIYSGQDVGASGTTGLLTDVDETRVFLVADGRVFFAGLTGTAEAFWQVNIDGSGLDAQVATGDPLPGSVSVLDLDAVGVSADGNRFAFVAEVGGVNANRLYAGTTGTSTYAPIAVDGGGLPVGGGTLLNVHAGGPLIVRNGGNVIWRARGTLPGTDDIVLRGDSVAPFVTLARSGQLAPTTASATFGALELLQHEPQGVTVLIRVQVQGLANGVDFATYALDGTNQFLALYEGRSAPSDLGQTTTFTDTVPGLGQPPYVDVAADGSLAAAALLANGTSGVFWLVPDCDSFTIAASGQAAPGGDTFGPFHPTAPHTSATGVVLFRASLTTAGSGLFRQGP